MLHISTAPDCLALCELLNADTTVNDVTPTAALLSRLLPRWLYKLTITHHQHINNNNNRSIDTTVGYVHHQLVTADVTAAHQRINNNIIHLLVNQQQREAADYVR